MIQNKRVFNNSKLNSIQFKQQLQVYILTSTTTTNNINNNNNS